jgi:hypothetical protein
MLANLTQKKPNAGQNIRPTSEFVGLLSILLLKGDMTKGLGGPDEANGKNWATDKSIWCDEMLADVV